MHPSIILFWEPITLSHNALDYFRNMIPTWHMVAMDSMGYSGVLVALWDRRWVSFNAYKCFGGILLCGHLRGLVGHFRILNIYAPYTDCCRVSDIMMETEILKLYSLIMVVDLNATTTLEECWQ